MRLVSGLTLALAMLAGAACGGGGEADDDDDDDDNTGVCAPDGGGPYWLEEGETVVFTIVCSNDAALDGAAVSIDGLPAGASYDAATATVSWTTDLDDAAVYEIALELGGELGDVKIGVADAYDTPGNVAVVDPLAYPEEFGLPVLFLEPGPLDSEIYAPATVIYDGHVYDAEGKKRGAASLGYPKNSYTLEFDSDDLFQEPRRAGGFQDKKKIVLISTFDDNSYVRQRLAYELWNRMDAEHIQIQVYSAVVYLDGAYWGLYTVADHVDDDLMLAHGLDPLGNLYKARNHDANFRLTKSGGGAKATLHDGYTKQEGTPLEGEAGAFDDLHELVEWAATSSDDTFFAEREARLSVRDFEDWWIFVTLILADDSAGKNSYLYHDPSGGPWRFAPWDFNHSFGQTWQTARQDGDYLEEYTGANHLFERFLSDGDVADAMMSRYGELLDGILELAEIRALVDDYIDEIDDSARRDERKWSDAYRSYGGWSWRDDFTSYDGEVEYLEDWIDLRWSFQDLYY
jgi:spore coat protein H